MQKKTITEKIQYESDKSLNTESLLIIINLTPPPPPVFKFQDLPLIFTMEMITCTDQQIDNAAHSELLDFTLYDLSVLQQMLQQLLNRVHKPQSLFLQCGVVTAQFVKSEGRKK